MHELSIAISIVELSEKEAKKANVSSVQEINLEVGTLSGIVVEALEFAMDEAVNDSVLQNAIIKIKKVPAIAKCLKCSKEFPVEDYYTPCPECNNFETELINGKELKIKSLVINK
ncbi:MAG: hydrogenase maturation nickel metallochaperone HypA [Bacteroidales bacterium]|nr:hydrogenase maturation nickel metallochaperone HypA [Bacteroidales bacterium]